MQIYEFIARIEVAENDIDALRHNRTSGHAIPADSLVRLSQAGLVHRTAPTDVGHALCCALENGLKPWKCAHDSTPNDPIAALLETPK